MSHPLETLKVRSSRSLDKEFIFKPPFSSQIMGEVILSKFKLPHIDPYDGTTNPFDHLESFKDLTLLHRAIDDILC